MNKRLKPFEEWFTQSKYDLETAEAMFKTRRYIYTVFMCHLSIEKALKGVYVKRLRKDPPKTHDLNYLCKLTELDLATAFQQFLDFLNDLSVPTRYPDEIMKLLKQYKKDKTNDVLKQTKGLLLWLIKKA